MAVANQETAPFRSRQHSVKKASVYVGDLRPDVTEEDLIVKFSSRVPIVSAHLCRCSATGKSLCYGYVNFNSCFIASNALACLNHTDMMGKPMRLMWFEKDQTLRRSGIGNLFVKNLASSITSSCLERIFSPFGSILSCKVAEENRQSRGFGFVQFDSEQSATSARCALHRSVIDGKKLYVSKFVKKTERAVALGKHDFTNLYVKNLSEGVTEDFLLKTFSPYGRVSSAVVMRDDTGKSRGFGFVSFSEAENARKAAEALNGAVLGSKKLFVGRAQTKAERLEILKHELEEKFISGFKNSKWLNLYVKNLSESIDETRLREIFGWYGRVISTKVMRHENGVSKGFGFVCLSNREESKKAKRELNGTFVDGKSLVVRVVERKEDRLKRLQRYFTEPSGQVPVGYISGWHFPHVPVRFPGQCTYIQPFHIGQTSFYMGGSQSFTSYLPVGQQKQNGNPQDKPSASSGTKTGQKHGLSGEENRSGNAETSLEEATSVLKAALMKSPCSRGSDS
ncbi:PREDICTED: polyadenylate-binding protein 6-like [Tarenaya hassleriana]|uniref:polyadenylate-binding protein 6-like n=1 Tax=Tarenaya hassleriana TaxID=28532 RepID=UPI00053C8E0E|nr:PREDICTED: polyadenylate-binding protein 6-like [Tarenaya hassleriana]